MKHVLVILIGVPFLVVGFVAAFAVSGFVTGYKLAEKWTAPRNKTSS